MSDERETTSRRASAFRLLADAWTDAAIAYMATAFPLGATLAYVRHPYLIGVAAIRCNECERLFLERHRGMQQCPWCDP